jgi:predicted aspartyl protease
MSGPVVEVLIAPAKPLVDILRSRNQALPQPIKALAMIDTGATSSVVRPDIIEMIGLSPIGIARINTPTTEGVECYQYQAAIVFPNNVAVETTDLIEAPLQGQHIQCLIGRDILKHGVLIYNGYAQIVTFSI